jgi:RTX calcium-binding nonapeptide repeat (4 copies)
LVYVKTLTACAISGALLTASTMLVPAAATGKGVGVETCHGQPATVAPGPGGLLMGTPLADVIVAHEGQRVDAGLGDDLICIVATRATENVDAGGGDDLVDATQSKWSSFVFLGVGEDTFLGALGDDAVYAAVDEGYGFPGPQPIDNEHDVIKTGRGDDFVFSGWLGESNDDEISTGQGNDRIELRGLDHDTVLNAGSGLNTAIVTLTADETQSWLIDVGKRKLHFDEATSHWEGQLQRWYLELAAGSARSSVVFLGTGASEYAFVSGPGLVPHFSMRGGADWAGNLDTNGGTYRLGAGGDRLTLGAYEDVPPSFPIERLVVDLGAGQADFGGGGKFISPVTGVETLFAGAVHLRVFGSHRADKITVNGCDVAAHGRTGNDLLIRDPHTVPSICDTVRTRLFGELGKDVLFGSQRTDDYLAGGPGFDRARGMMGTDTCYAEVKRGCELP